MATIRTEEIYGYEIGDGKVAHWDCALKEFDAKEIEQKCIILKDDVNENEEDFCSVCGELIP